MSPEQRAHLSARVSASMTPKRREQIRQQQRARFADPAEREAASERMRKVWAELRGEVERDGTA